MKDPITIYIAGPVTGVHNYRETFMEAEEDVNSHGYIALSPAHLPQGMTNEQYMRICFAMIDAADAVLFLEGWENSPGATLEHNYAKYTKKPIVCQHRQIIGEGLDTPTRRAWLALDLKEVLT